MKTTQANIIEINNMSCASTAQQNLRLSPAFGDLSVIPALGLHFSNVGESGFPAFCVFTDCFDREQNRGLNLLL